MKDPNNLEIFISIVATIFTIIMTYFYYKCRKEHYITRASCKFNKKFIIGIDKTALDTLVFGLAGCIAVFYPYTYFALLTVVIYTILSLRYIKISLGV